MSSKAEPVPTEPIHLSDDGDLDDVVSTYDVVLADFYADWCGPCQMMEPAIESVAADTDAAVVKVDVDRFQGLASQFGVQGIPALFLFADGENVEQLVGMKSEEQLSNVIDRYTE
ncbi:co-chaperone YbbN [Natronomonas sp. LN261]|jgi:thioredoxin 1|uniref:thioredoxin family protein n=1 Tax=Natronomonas sp. LN261 TaxID=2750669 RepID=UPI0015EFACEC|nr:thioredoxin family protein [Natronomonas sp. LN261]